MIRLTVQHSAGGLWHPIHPDLWHDISFLVPPESHMTEEQIREAVFELVEAKFPGKYTLGLDLDEVRQDFFELVDRRTFELVEQGFVHQGIRFSCSERAQIRYNGMIQLASGMTYPLEINSLDDTKRLVLESPEETIAFCVAAANHVRNLIDSGTVLKKQACAATTKEEIDAVVDDRMPPIGQD